MSTLMKALIASAALAGLAGCASYDYGYAYEQPYYSYDYGYGPYAYGPYAYGPYADGPYAYDYGYPYYGPGYYYGGPAIGFNFGFRDHDRFHRRGRFDRHERADRRSFERGHASLATPQQAPRPARVNQAGNQPRAGTVARQRAPAAPTAERARARGERRPAQATMRAEQ